MEPLQSYEPLRQIAPDLFCVDGEWYDTAFRRRMTVVRLKDSSLVIHSAIRMDEQGLVGLDKLGRVGAIVVPNAFHDSDAPFYAERYPGASVYVPGKVRAKCEKRMRVTGVLENGWPFQDELRCISFENWLVAESVFVHRASRTLVVTDMAMNMSPGDFKSTTERLLLGKWNGLFRGFGPSGLFKLVSRRDPGGVGAAAFRELAEQDFDRVVVGHGRIVENGGKALFLDGYARIYGAG